MEIGGLISLGGQFIRICQLAFGGAPGISTIK